MSLRIALFGQADFGKQCLDRLVANGHHVVGVFTPPAGGRPDALAARAEELELPLIQRRHFQKRGGDAIPAALDSYQGLGAELNVLASFTSFLPPEITNAPTRRSICFHPSLLPRFRGGAALQWQIILGEVESGVSIFVPDEGVDTGPIVVQKGGVKLEAQDTVGSLFFKKLAPLGVEAILEAVDLIDRGQAEPWDQDESRATFQGLVGDEAARIDLTQPAERIDRLVRGCDPQPGAHVRWRGKPVRLLDAGLEPTGSGEPGFIIGLDERGLVIALEGASLRVGRVRADAGKEPARDFAERVGLALGDRLESG